MKKCTLLVAGAVVSSLFVSPLAVLAQEDPAYETQGTITFEEGTEINLPLDPENPDPENPVTPLDPPQPGTGGALSIDYASKFKFGTQSISTKNQTYYALPDEFSDGVQRPTYVQVTDKRGTFAGWKLRLAQPEQFHTADGVELVGAELTFGKGKVASNVDEQYKPSTVSNELILQPGGTSQVAVQAATSEGIGTWTYRFGSDVADNADAVRLFVPGKSVKLAQQYSAKLVWSLEASPANQ